MDFGITWGVQGGSGTPILLPSRYRLHCRFACKDIKTCHGAVLVVWTNK